MAAFRISRPSARVLILSGNLQGEVRRELQSIGPAVFVQKPYALDDVGRRLRALLDEPVML